MNLNRTKNWGRIQKCRGRDSNLPRTGDISRNPLLFLFWFLRGFHKSKRFAVRMISLSYRARIGTNPCALVCVHHSLRVHKEWRKKTILGLFHILEPFLVHCYIMYYARIGRILPSLEPFFQTLRLLFGGPFRAEES